MLKPIHVEITRAALEAEFTPRALEKIIKANLYQDRPRGQIGHPEYHFDDNEFEESAVYMEEQRALTVSALLANDAPSAWAAFGRLTHAAQDFYAHSNYVDLWLTRQSGGAIPTPSEIDPMHPELINARSLRSGKIYPLELLSFIRILKPLVMSLLPRDSHGWLNIDSPKRGPNFPYAYQAAVKRTRIEFDKTTEAMPMDLLRIFVDK